MSLRSLLKACAKAFPAAESGHICQYTLHPDQSLFAGHFPENPILPAVVQCLMVQMLVEEMLQHEATFYDVVDAKFMAPIVPPCVVQVHVDAGRKKGQYVGVVTVENVLCAKITLREQVG